jgi:2-polyprenyl-3-methyl-5-hydroxy-6-metoxy-1,4-benzoquinol methylase
MISPRSDREIVHGYLLAQSDPEAVWGWRTLAGRLRAARRAEMIASGALLQPGICALEIGCGTGLFTEMFAATGAQLVAVDISPDLLDIARARGLSADRVQFLQKRFEDCDVNAPFDAVLGSSVLHHLDIEAALTRIFELLKPQGIMSFAEPNMLNPQIMIQKNIWWLKRYLGDSPDETAFVRYRLRKLLLRAGFVDIQITPFDWLHPATPAAMISPVQKVGLILEKIPLMREFAGSLYIRCCRPEEGE